MFDLWGLQPPTVVFLVGCGVVFVFWLFASFGFCFFRFGFAGGLLFIGGSGCWGLVGAFWFGVCYSVWV